VFPEAWKITGDEIIKFQKRKYTCYKCPIACGAITEVPQGPFATLGETHKPQYETLGALGILCLIDSPESMIRFNEICNRAGLDTISTGGVIAFAIECYENGLITRHDTGGLDLSWGDGKAALALTEMVAYREGFGDILADGVRVASQKIGKGSEKYAIHISGQELPMHDPKNTNGLALSYILDATPGRHSTGGELLSPPGFEVFKQKKGVYTGRAESHQKLVNIYHVSNAAGNCMLAYFFVSAQSIPLFISATTGWDFDMNECMAAGERIQIIRHAFNLREGYNPLNNLNTISDRIFGNEPLKDGPNKGINIDVKAMIEEYLAYADWDPVTTIPSREKLIGLKLEEVADTFY
jgi:aldehyde:ferredoxin oxidoreductase